MISDPSAIEKFMNLELSEKEYLLLMDIVDRVKLNDAVMELVEKIKLARPVNKGLKVLSLERVWEIEKKIHKRNLKYADNLLGKIKKRGLS